jgi:hypothetical protein
MSMKKFLCAHIEHVCVREFASQTWIAGGDANATAATSRAHIGESLLINSERGEREHHNMWWCGGVVVLLVSSLSGECMGPTSW